MSYLEAIFFLKRWCNSNSFLPNSASHMFLRPLLHFIFNEKKKHRWQIIVKSPRTNRMNYFQRNLQSVNNSEMWHKLLLINDTITVSLCYFWIIKWQHMRILGSITSDTTKLVARETQTVCCFFFKLSLNITWNWILICSL